MDELRIRPKSDFLHTASWQELYVITEHWISDIKFYEDEITFFYLLIDRHFSILLEDENLDSAKKLSDDMDSLSNHVLRLRKKTNKHLQHLEELVENAYSHDEQVFRDEHEQLENEIAAFVKKFRRIKTELFTMTEKLVNNDRLQHLLNSGE